MDEKLFILKRVMVNIIVLLCRPLEDQTGPRYTLSFPHFNFLGSTADHPAVDLKTSLLSN